jgi:hypothetical protein
LDLKAGDAFFNLPTKEIPRHLWIVVSDPTEDPARVLIANVTSWGSDRDADDSCILEAGDHPHIRHKSFVNYHGVTEITAGRVARLLDRGMLSPTQPVTAKVLQKVRQGLMTSQFSKTGHKDLLRQQGLAS